MPTASSSKRAAFGRDVCSVPVSGRWLGSLLAVLMPFPLGWAQSIRIPPPAEPLPVITNLIQLSDCAAADPRSCYALRLEGSVWWAAEAQGRVVLQDASAAVELELAADGPFAKPGRRMRLIGDGTVTRRGNRFQLGIVGPVVDNDGVHAMSEKSATVFLKAGRNPFRVEWFNGVEKSGLKLEYQGPGLTRQPIPDGALFHAGGKPGAPDHGLEFRCCEADGELLPDFGTLPALRTGVVASLELTLLPRAEHVAMEFSGQLDVPRDGGYTFYLTSDDGSRLFVGRPTFRFEAIGVAAFPEPRRITVGQVFQDGGEGQWVVVEGKVARARAVAGGLELELEAGAGRMRAEVGDPAGLSPATVSGVTLRAIGFCQRVHAQNGQHVAGTLLVPGPREIEILSPQPRVEGAVTGGNATAALPLLTSAAAVHRLKRDEARRDYPVRLRGVVTCVLREHQAFTIQDATRGLYVVDRSSDGAPLPQIGEYLEITGTTDPGLFAPIVNAQLLVSLGAGQLPEPVRPTWDQLINGSLDAQFVEVQGIVTGARADGLTLLTRSGVVRIALRLNGLSDGPLVRFENALVRVRGTLFANWDYVTHQVKLGEVRIYAADIAVDEPPSADLFSSPRKTVGELLLFDPQAGVFQRVKLSGQIVQARETEFFMMDGGRGLRFTTRQPAALAVGDLVEVVGFPDLLGTPSPVLREAEARKTGRAAQPAPEKLSADQLLHTDHDATRVQVEGVLLGERRAGGARVLDVQNGVRTFVARLDAAETSTDSLPVGSRLELTGVYVGLGGNRARGQDIASFELLLDSPAGIRVLARPPWWTLKRLLVIVGALALVLAAAALWITQLHRQVEERTHELAAQIQQRQRIESEHAMEQERARIAQDLHDELGSGITEMSMLAARAKSAAAPGERRERYLDQVGDTALELVTALDEIVWAMNPRHDSLASLVSYFSLYADRFLTLANIAWRLEGPGGPPDHVVNSRHRHQLFLAFKEALTNVVRHSGATEVRWSIQVENGGVRMVIADNGRGLPSGGPTGEMDGVLNMRRRVEQLGGRFGITSEPGRGATLNFFCTRRLNRHDPDCHRRGQQSHP